MILGLDVDGVAAADAPFQAARAVSFDLGGTLVQLPDGTATTSQVAAVLGIPLARVRSWMETGPKLRRRDVAELADQLAVEFARPDARPRLQQVLDHARQAACKPSLFDDALPVLAALRRRGYQLLALSNAIGSSAPNPDPSFYRYFDAVFASYDTGICKPDRAAFALVERAMRLRPHELLHVGDSVRVDVHGAVHAGWSAVHLDRSDASQASSSPSGHLPVRCVSVLSAVLSLLPDVPTPVHESPGVAACP